MEAKLAAGIEIIAKNYGHGYMYKGYPNVYRTHLAGDIEATYGLAEHFYYGMDWPNEREGKEIYRYLVDILIKKKHKKVDRMLLKYFYNGP